MSNRHSFGLPQICPSVSTYDPSFIGNEVLLSPAGAVYHTTWGPSFLKSLNLLPASSKVIMDINLLNNSYEIASNQASAVVQALGSKLDAFESMLNLS